MSTLTHTTSKHWPRRARRSGDSREPRLGRRATQFMVMFAFYVLVPIWWLLVASSKRQSDITTTNGLWFTQPFELITNTGHVFTYDSGSFVRRLGNSMVYARGGAALGTLFTNIAGYALGKYVSQDGRRPSTSSWPASLSRRLPWVCRRSFSSAR